MGRRQLISGQDQPKNSYGKKLIDLGISANTKILNGRTIGNLVGKYTYLVPCLSLYK